MRKESLRCVTSVFTSGNEIYARTSDIRTSSTFDKVTGERLSGLLDLTKEEILFLSWRQRQSPSLSDSVLFAEWEKRKGR